MSRLLIVLFFITTITVHLANSQPRDSLLHELNQRSGAERIPVLHELLRNVWLNYPDLALQYGREAEEISRIIRDSANISRSIRLMAGVYYYRGDYETSLEFNIKALNIATSLKDTSLINNCYNNIGLINYDIGNHQTALEFLLKSQQLKKKAGLVYGLPSVLNNIGLVYEDVGNYRLAGKYFKEALYLSEVAQLEDLEVYSKNNIAEIYLKEGRLDDALALFTNAGSQAQQINNVNWGAVSFRGIAKIYLAKSNLDSALHYLTRAIKESRSVQDKKGLSEGYHLLSQLYKLESSDMLALNYLDSSQALAMDLKSRTQLLENISTYIDIYTKQNRTDKVIEYQNSYIGMRDSLFANIVKRNLALVPLKIKEESDRIQLSAQKAQLKQNEIKTRLYAVLLIVSIPLLAILVFLLRKIRQTNIKINNRNYEITKQNEEIELQKSEIEQQNHKLLESIDQLRRTQSLLVESEKMASIGQLVAGLAHELNNPLNVIGGVIKPLEMNLSEIQEKSTYDTDVSEAIEDIHLLLEGIKTSTSRASGIIEKLTTLSPKARSEELEEFDLSGCLEEVLSLARREHSSVSVTKTIPDALSIRANYYELTKIFYNILSNAFEAVSNGEGLVSVVLNQTSDEYIVEISDTGPGISASELKNIFEPFYTTKQDYGASGLGLFVAYTLAQRNKIPIHVKSTRKQGTTFTLELSKKSQQKES